MVKGFKIRTEDLVTMRQIKLALVRLPKDMSYKIVNKIPLEIDITPATEKVKVAMYNDKLTGKKGEATKKQYLNVITPFFRQDVRNIKKMEILVYD